MARSKIGPVNQLFNRPIDSFEITYARSLISIPIGRLKEGQFASGVTGIAWIVGFKKRKISRKAAKPPRKSRKEDYEDYSGSPLAMRVMPSLISATLKLISKPKRLLASRRWVRSCFLCTGNRSIDGRQPHPKCGSLQPRAPGKCWAQPTMPPRPPPCPQLPKRPPVSIL